MDTEDPLIRADGWFWHLSNVILGPAILLATVLYVPPGTHSLNLIIASVDPFYLLVPLSVLYTCWCVRDLLRWYEGDEVL
jgi:hypothetical protein